MRKQPSLGDNGRTKCWSLKKSHDAAQGLTLWHEHMFARVQLYSELLEVEENGRKSRLSGFSRLIVIEEKAPGKANREQIRKKKLVTQISSP